MTPQEKEVYEVTLGYWKRLNKKLKGKPESVQVLQKRTMNTASAIIINLIGIPFQKLSMSLYFYCQDLRMNEFTHLYESQLELAGANQEKFVFQLHSFFNQISAKIKKENLYTEYFEFLYRCNRLRITMNDDHVEKQVVVAYLNLLVQTLEYLRPSKFDFSQLIAGRKTNGELILMKDKFPLLDMPGYELEEYFQNLKTFQDPTEITKKIYGKYGYKVNDFGEMQLLSNMDKIHGNAVSSMLPFINEFTFDMLPTTPYSTNTLEFHEVLSLIAPQDLKVKLAKRKRTLPSNGVKIFFKTNPVFKVLTLKEIYFDDSIYMLYKIETKEGDLSGFYDTKGMFFFSILSDYDYPEVLENLSALILYLYGCYTLNDPLIISNKVGEFITYQNQPFEVEGFLQGGKLKNTLDPHTEENRTSVGTARIGNENFEKEMKSIQGFIRKLPEGQRPSEKAIILAESLGYDLDLDETFVQPFIKQVFKLKAK